MSEPNWKLIKNPCTGQEDIVWREWEDGHQESCFVTSIEFQEWIAKGNTPLPADEGTV